MYNRYIGNTGKVIRVDEPRDNAVLELYPARAGDRREPPPPAHKKPGLFGGLGGLSGLTGFGGLSNLNLPFGLDTSDLIILALLLFLFLESGDEEFLIMLGFLAYSVYKDHRDL